LGIKEKYYVERISYNDIKDWILKKHYAHCIPTVVFSFGLFNENKLLSGVCTFGMACANEYKAWLPYKLYELNRFVCINEKNIASFFLSQSIKNLKNIVGTCVLVSYADIGQGHSGYIYQATNWIYTGICGYGNRIFIMKDGSKKHNRHYKNIDLRMVSRIEKTSSKHRYYYFIGNKKNKKEMLKKLRFKIIPYPKGDNKKYNTNCDLNIQNILF